MAFFHWLLPSSPRETDASFAPGAFSRKRCLTLPVVLGLVINMVRPGRRRGYQEVIDRFYSESGLMAANRARGLDKPPDKSAFLRARRKVPLAVFQDLFTRAGDEAIRLSEALGCHRWHGFRVWAVDGTKKTLPGSDELAEAFGIPPGASFPQAWVVTVFDVMARVPINSVWGPYWASERELGRHLLKDVPDDVLVVLDRGYPSFELLAELVAKGQAFLIRLPRDGMFGAVSRFLSAGRRDGVVTIDPPRELVSRCRREGIEPPNPVRVRVVKVALSKKGRGHAVFVTSLMDRKKYTFAALRNLYHRRWEEEEYFKLCKQLLEAENCRGRSKELIDQEMIALHLYCILVRILMLHAAHAKGVDPSTIAQQHAFLAVTRYLDRMLLASDEHECLHLTVACIDEISWRRYRKRPGRSYPRRSKSSYGKWGRKAAAA